MKIPGLVILFALGFAGISPAEEVGESTVTLTLDEAREAGRLKSRLLKDVPADARKSDVIPTANVADFEKFVKPNLLRSCMACHGPETSEGRLRVDELDPDVLTGSDVDRWREIYNVLSNSEMPPEDEAEYARADVDRSNIVDWLSGELNKASVIRRNKSEHSSFRRLTRYEYNYALQDLLGLLWSLADKLPPENASEDGFKNSSELLQMSVMQFETYREIGLKALKRATVSGDRPQPVTYIISMREEMERATASKNAKTFSQRHRRLRKATEPGTPV